LFFKLMKLSVNLEFVRVLTGRDRYSWSVLHLVGLSEMITGPLTSATDFIGVKFRTLNYRLHEDISDKDILSKRPSNMH
jgi:hypothetical protein